MLDLAADEVRTSTGNTCTIGKVKRLKRPLPCEKAKKESRFFFLPAPTSGRPVVTTQQTNPTRTGHREAVFGDKLGRQAIVMGNPVTLSMHQHNKHTQTKCADTMRVFLSEPRCWGSNADGQLFVAVSRSIFQRATSIFLQIGENLQNETKDKSQKIWYYSRKHELSNAPNGT